MFAAPKPKSSLRIGAAASLLAAFSAAAHLAPGPGVNPPAVWSEPPLTHSKAQNRYRDLAIAPDGLRIYVLTTSYGRTLTATGSMTADLENPGSLLEFRYSGSDL